MRLHVEATAWHPGTRSTRSGYFRCRPPRRRDAPLRWPRRRGRCGRPAKRCRSGPGRRRYCRHRPRRGSPVPARCHGPGHRGMVRTPLRRLRNRRRSLRSRRIPITPGPGGPAPTLPRCTGLASSTPAHSPDPDRPQYPGPFRKIDLCRTGQRVTVRAIAPSDRGERHPADGMNDMLVRSFITSR